MNLKNLMKVKDDAYSNTDFSLANFDVSINRADWYDLHTQNFSRGATMPWSVFCKSCRQVAKDENLTFYVVKQHYNSIGDTWQVIFNYENGGTAALVNFALILPPSAEYEDDLTAAMNID